MNIMETKKMKAVVATGYGSPEVLKYQEVDMPEPGAHEVLVRVRVSSATTADGMMRTGKPLYGRLFTGLRKPKHAIPGTGFAGEVVHTGEEVRGFKQGDAVFGETTLGFSTNAEFVTVPEHGVILHKPEGLGFEEAASFCDGPLTSLYFLKEIASVKPGHKVLINGASGSLGSAAVQLAKKFGAEVTGVCSTRNAGWVKSLGADEVIDYVQHDFSAGEKYFDVIYDTVGKSSFRQSRKVLTEHGMYLSPVLKVSLLFQMMRTSLLGQKKAKFAASGLKSDDELRTLLSELLEIYQEGRLKIHIDRQFPLEKVAQAHRYIAQGHKKGNVIILAQS
jgi:NADPH:quinone reductase-like Zn-dependent oxidoreductase